MEKEKLFQEFQDITSKEQGDVCIVLHREKNRKGKSSRRTTEIICEFEHWEI